MTESTSTASSATEYWNPIPDYPDYYVSNIGRLWSKKKKMYLNVREDDTGRLFATISVNGKYKKICIENQILRAFNGPPDDDRQVAKLKDPKKAATLMNLRWGYTKEKKK